MLIEGGPYSPLLSYLYVYSSFTPPWACTGSHPLLSAHFQPDEIYVWKYPGKASRMWNITDGSCSHSQVSLSLRSSRLHPPPVPPRCAATRENAKILFCREKMYFTGGNWSSLLPESNDFPFAISRDKAHMYFHSRFRSSVRFGYTFKGNTEKSLNPRGALGR